MTHGLPVGWKRVAERHRSRVIACLAVVIAIGGGVVSAAPALAARESHGRHGDWQVFTDRTADGRVCFASTTAAPGAVGGAPTMSIATWRGSGPKEQPSLHAGVTLRDGGGTRAIVGGRSYRMFVDGAEAFGLTADDDRRLVAAMRAGSTMTVRSVTEDGARITHRFSLAGVTRALRDVASLCS